MITECICLFNFIHMEVLEPFSSLVPTAFITNKSPHTVGEYTMEQLLIFLNLTQTLKK